MKLSLMVALLLNIICASNVVAQSVTNEADMSLAGTSKQSNGTALLPGTTPWKAQNIGPNEFRLTEANNWQAGSIWSKDYIDLKNDFTIEGAVYFGDGDGGADGIAFILQPYCAGLGVLGMGMGYQGIEPSFAIEFDTHSNGNHDFSGDHIGFAVNGNISKSSHIAQHDFGTTNIEDGKYHNIKISWDAKTFEMTLIFNHGAANAETIKNAIPKNLVKDVFTNSSYVYWGFSSATGTLNAEHKVKLTKWPAANTFPYIVKDATKGSNDGSITMNMSEKASYQWSNGKGIGSSIANLAAGIYTVTATNTFDINGNTTTCPSIFDITVNSVPELIGHWTFEDKQERTDLTGNFETLTMIGATVSDGCLNVADGKWAVVNMTAKKSFQEKTLVAWAKVNDLNMQGGSILSLDYRHQESTLNPAKNIFFDAIVYGEKQAGKWMAGSDWFNRTKNLPENYVEEANTLVKITITYKMDNTITVYRNNDLVGSYKQGKILNYNNTAGAQQIDVFFGIRHSTFGASFPGKPFTDASIEEARIYAGVLSKAQISSLTLVKQQ